MLCIAGVANAATEYEIDQKFTSIAALEGKMFAIADETSSKALGIGVAGHANGWDSYFGTYTEVYASNACYYKIEAAQGDDVSGYYYLRTFKADGTMYTAWSDAAHYGYFNSQTGQGGYFALGLEGRNGQDAKNHAVWDIQESDGKFSIKNVGTGKYLHADQLSNTYEDAYYFTFCTFKEKPQTDPLADQKDALTAAIAQGKMYKALAYTEATFAAVGTAVSDGETALAAAGATAESLTAATKAITDAIAALAFKDGFSSLKDVDFGVFDGWGANAKLTQKLDPTWDLFKATGQSYGDPSVNNRADVSAFDKLYIAVVSGTPRILLNRDADGGQWNEDETKSHLIDNTKGGWSAKYFSTENGIVTVDLKQLVADKGFAHLTAIKSGDNNVISGLYLYKEAVAEPTVVTFDIKANPWEHALGSGSGSTAEAGNITEPIVVDGVTLSFDQASASTPSRFWSTSSGAELRIYKDSKMKIAAPEGKAITKIEFTAGDFGLAATPEGLTSKVWEGNSTNVEFTPSKTNKITKIDVTITAKNSETVDPKPVEPVHIANTAETAYTVAKAIELIDAGEALSDSVYVKGIVSQVDKFDETDKYITYWISDDGTTTNQFELYHGKGIKGADFASIDDVEVGAEVIVVGLLAKYGTTYEFKADNQLVSYKAPAKPAIAEGKYYIYNPAANGFIVGANNWGTRASISELGGIEFEAVLADGKYELKSAPAYAGKHLGTDGYVDNGKADQKDWTITPVEGQEGVFTLATADGKFLFWDGGEATTTSVGAMPATAANAYWKFVTKEERAALFANASAENPVDATFFIVNPDFGRSSNKAVWQGDDFSIGGGNDVNNNAEKWGGNSQNFDVHQTVTIPDGKYLLKWNGFYRYNNTTENTNEVAAAAHAAGTEVINSFVYANDSIVPLTSIADEASVALNGGMPFSQADAAAAFAKGAYEQSLELVVIGGNLTIGVKKTNHEGTDWTIWDNFRLFYIGGVPADMFKPAYEDALKAAQDALAAEAYATITGEERTALEQAVKEYATVEDNADAYQAATAALTTATTTFTNAKGAYDALATAKATYATYSFKYASAEKKAAAEGTLTADATSADDAKAKSAVIVKAYRQYAESSALAEGVEDAKNMTDSIVNPKAESAVAEPWVVESQSSNGSMGILSNEPWTDGDDNATHSYFDGYAWGQSAWDATMKQEIKLPAGKYQLTVKSRGSQDLTIFRLFAGEATVDMQHINADGGLFNRGWNDASVEFELADDGTIAIGVQGATETVHNWMSFADFRLVQLEEPAPVVAHTWDFTKWSEATVTNLKAEAAKVTVEADPAKEGNTMCTDNDALWSDHEKKPGTTCDTYAASKDNCFWYIGGEAEPKANGEAIAEFAGLEFNTTYGASRALAIAVNYPSTSLGTYNGPAYLWFGGKGQTILTIKNVKAGTQIKMGVESHKPAEGRGVQLLIGETVLTDPEGAAVAAPKEYTAQTWQVPAGEGVVDVIVKNTNGCHVYFIDAEIGEAPQPVIADGLYDLTDDMFHVWSGIDENAVITDEQPGFGKAIGQNVKAGSLVYGNGSVVYLQYADITGYDSLAIVGTPTLQYRVLMNRLEVGNGGGDANGGALTEVNPVPNEKGVAFVDLTKYDKVRLNSIKLGWGSPEGFIDRVVLVKGAWDETITGISTVKSVKMDGTIYNLNGQKVNKTQKGLYIVNGKKVVLK